MAQTCVDAGVVDDAAGRLNEGGKTPHIAVFAPAHVPCDGGSASPTPPFSPQRSTTSTDEATPTPPSLGGRRLRLNTWGLGKTPATPVEVIAIDSNGAAADLTDLDGEGGFARPPDITTSISAPAAAPQGSWGRLKKRMSASMSLLTVDKVDRTSGQKKAEAVELLRTALLDHFGTKEAAFEALDENLDGTVSLEEFEECFVTHGISKEKTIGTLNLRKLFKELDADASGGVDVCELFDTTMEERRAMSMQQMASKMERAWSGRSTKAPQRPGAMKRSPRPGTMPAHLGLPGMSPRFGAMSGTMSPRPGSVSPRSPLSPLSPEADRSPWANAMALGALQSVSPRIKGPKLSDEEYVTSLRNYLIRRFGSAQQAFEALDEDGSGDLDIFEFKIACVRVGMTVEAASGGASAEYMFGLLDTDDGGSLSFQELFNTTAEMRQDPIQKLRRYLIRELGDERAAFAALDTNANGDLSQGELLDSLSRRMLSWHKATDGADFKTVFNNLDIEGRGELTFHDLFKSTWAERHDPVNRLRRFLANKYGSHKKAFEAIDKNRDGELSKQELRFAFGSQHINIEKITGVHFDDLFGLLDFDASGTLSFFELFKSTYWQRQKAKLKARRKKRGGGTKNHGKQGRRRGKRGEGEEGSENSGNDSDLSVSSTELELPRTKGRFPGVCKFAEDAEATDLSIKSDFIGYYGAQIVALAIKAPSEKRKMKCLDLTQGYMGSRGLFKLMNVIDTHCTVERLILSWNGIGDSGAQRIADSIRRIPQLTSVDLSSNRICDAGAEALAYALMKRLSTKGTSFASLDLRHNAIGVAGINHLMEAATYSPPPKPKRRNSRCNIMVSRSQVAKVEDNLADCLLADYEDAMWMVDPGYGEYFQDKKREFDEQRQQKLKLRKEEEEAMAEAEGETAAAATEEKPRCSTAPECDGPAEAAPKASEAERKWRQWLRPTPTERYPAAQYACVQQLNRVVSDAILAGQGLLPRRPLSQGSLRKPSAPVVPVLQQEKAGGDDILDEPPPAEAAEKAAGDGEMAEAAATDQSTKCEATGVEGDASASATGGAVSPKSKRKSRSTSHGALRKQLGLVLDDECQTPTSGTTPCNKSTAARRSGSRVGAFGLVLNGRPIGGDESQTPTASTPSSKRASKSRGSLIGLASDGGESQTPCKSASKARAGLSGAPAAKTSLSKGPGTPTARASLSKGPGSPSARMSLSKDLASPGKGSPQRRRTAW
eukprot:TRINITY_DN20142_c0_g1_i1.p1 TRINITY_DN20142_c0_g1~~TRINITY_DN20142_c0_g1_i1.p1  ORF type:complete len:1229 (+),score=316.37 TRINITY_DN20142_c0_g1_i1:245-3931(+)